MASISFWNLLGEYKVLIPILQRDYAQGRKTGKVPLIREKFLQALISALKAGERPLELDFVYGYTSEYSDNSGQTRKVFVPLDGQQRLTTLFLMHWFIAVNENQLPEAQERLSKFTYETRHSSILFCQKLVGFKPENISTPISSVITNESWFFTAWRNDPTINSMLTVLDDFQRLVKANELDTVWHLLVGEKPQISFYLLPMEKLGLADELYIKMNSRGKQLTEFEYFKSRFPERLTQQQADIFNKKVDQEWSDLFWNLYKYSNEKDIAAEVDEAFLRFFRYITDLLISINNLEVAEEREELEIFGKVYATKENADFLFACLEIFHATFKTDAGFFNSVFYINPDDYNLDKTRLFFQSPAVDLFRKCAANYNPIARSNPFSIGEQLLLYACIIHLKEQTQEFITRLRVIRNLVANSADTVRKENMAPLLASVAEIVRTGKIDEDMRFNKLQIKEETQKQLFLEQNLQLKEAMYRLEDNRLLQGCLAIFKLELDLTNYEPVFNFIFSGNGNYDENSCGLLTFGDYSYLSGKSHRQLGNNNDTTWRELFTPSSAKKGFQNTQTVLESLLKHLIQNPTASLENIISSYLNKFDHNEKEPKDWRYYFIRYQEFRRHEDGYYYWQDYENKPYECIMMRRTTFIGFNWSPFLLAIKEKNARTNLGNYGSPLTISIGNSEIKITNLNGGFKLEATGEDGAMLMKELKSIKYIDNDNIFTIEQSPDGIDLIDRVEKGGEFIAKLISVNAALTGNTGQPVESKKDEILNPLMKVR